MLSIIIPVYNEKYTIGGIIQRVQRLHMDKEIIIVDDGSTDGTTEILRNLESTEKREIKIIYHKLNRGKGAAIRTALNYVGGDLVAIQDADFEYDPGEFPKLIAPIIEGKADVVYGSRFRDSECQRRMYFWHMIANKILSLLSNAFTDLNLSDIETCHKVFKAHTIRSIEIEESRFGFEVEITAKLAQRECRFYEVGISYLGRTHLEGKKIGWKDGIRALWCIVKYNTIAKWLFKFRHEICST
jgi:glycosyltransferase involved in cell wall biosynthesis